MRQLFLCVSVLVLGCSGKASRYGEASVSAAAPRLVLSGTTFGEAAAMELAPGCPGYLDPETPSHVVHVQESLQFEISASSDRGPLAIAVAHGDEVRCDSDEGSGHAPSIALEGAGDYLVYVAALRAPAALPYEVRVAAEVPAAAPSGEPVAQNAGLTDVSVTITSQPAGASVRDAQGNVVGTTPAMFVLTIAPNEIGQDRSWTLGLDGYQPTTVTGRMSPGAMVLHGQLVVAAPRRIELVADAPQPIRDYQTATLGVDVADDCRIGEAEVEVELRHSFIGDLRIVLHAPGDQQVSLHRHGGGGRANLRRTWRASELSELRGRSSRGRWELVVHDDAGADTGTLERFALRLTCEAGSAPSLPANVLSPVPNAPAPPVPPPAPMSAVPTREQIVLAMSAVRPRVESCADGSTALVNVRVTFASTGSVTQASVQNGSGALAYCVERAVRGARVPAFTQPAFTASYPFQLPRGSRAPTQVLDPWAGRR